MCRGFENSSFFLDHVVTIHTLFIALQKIYKIGLELINQPSYSPDLTPSDPYLFPKLKIYLKDKLLLINKYK